MTKIPTTIITGFLGAGKTTLLNRVLTGKHAEKIAVIVNEFGEVGIDGQLVVATEETVVELNNGCICCTVRDDLIAAVGRILASGRPVDRFVIETTGLADPAPIIQSFMLDETIRTNLTLDDALAKRAKMSTRNFSRVFLRDVGVTPADFVESARLDAARRMLQDTSLPLQRIAGTCGFGDLHGMRRVFRRNLGVGPTDYRGAFQTSVSAPKASRSFARPPRESNTSGQDRRIALL